VFGGDSGLTFNSTTDLLTVDGGVLVPGTPGSQIGGIFILTGDAGNGAGTLTIQEGGFDVTGTSTISGGDLSLAAGRKLILEGAGTDSYLTWDPGSREVRVYIDGALKGRITPSGDVSGPCGPNLYALPGGGECFDRATGKLISRTVRGLVKQ